MIELSVFGEALTDDFDVTDEIDRFWCILMKLIYSAWTQYIG